MGKHSEKDYIIPALLVIRDQGGDCTTDKIKENVGTYITLNEEDKKPLMSRNPNEPGYYQIVGNLISHKNPHLQKYVNLIVSEEEKLKKSPKYIWVLNEEGKKYIERFLSNLTEEKSKKEINESLGYEIDTIDEKIIECAKKSNLKKRPITDANLKENVKIINGYKCQYAIYSHQNHLMFNKNDGTYYVEVHHLIPLKASKFFFPRNLDRASNLVCLCPKCHAVLHHGSKDEKSKILKTIYDRYIDQLNDEEIYISFEDLLNKYYN